MKALRLHLSKVKLLNKELEALREAGAQSAESLQSTQTVNLELEERLQRGAQELRDLAAVKDARCGAPPVPRGWSRCVWRCLPLWLIAGQPGCRPLPTFPPILVLFRIKDLEGRLHSVQLTRQKEKETFRRK